MATVPPSPAQSATSLATFVAGADALSAASPGSGAAGKPTAPAPSAARGATLTVPIPPGPPPARGHLLAMPFLVLNMGVEMIYILDQRLKAQSISAEKSRKGVPLAFCRGV
jgi:hypothetical protein